MTDEKEKLPKLPQLQEKITSSLTQEEINLARKLQRDMLTNAHQNPPNTPRIPVYTDTERICKGAILQYRDNINKILQEQQAAGKPAIKTNPDGSRHELLSIQMHLKLERIEIQGSELIKRFNFSPKIINPKQIVNAYQLAMFKELRTKPLVIKFGEEIDVNYEKSNQYFKSSDNQPIKEMYDMKDTVLVYHAFYPLASKGDTKAKALLELYQGLVSTMFAWGMNHQETVSKELTKKKVEENRAIIEEKVKEFNDLIGFDPKKQEDE